MIHLKKIAFIYAALGAFVYAPSVNAHVVFAETTAKTGAYYFGFLRVGHGCEGAATTAVTVQIPEGIYAAKPQPKAGWETIIEWQALPEPVAGPHGKTQTKRVASLTWEGGVLDDSMFDQFGVQVKLPQEAQTLYFPVVQKCGDKEVRWDMIPEPGKAWHSVSKPAPMLEIANPSFMSDAHH
ncbi:YcnI family copper-binding membrane protein [Kordiimonas pumila]|uniref:YcnI family protein n=1 Tax=Kordiimonas pumila TaxID=2161677 RepID=A0ABV7D1V6_9PROT|nr:YcnI family protein [Kordiimonas pumila]